VQEERRRLFVSFSALLPLATWQKGHLSCKTTRPLISKGCRPEHTKEEKSKGKHQLNKVDVKKLTKNGVGSSAYSFSNSCSTCFSEMTKASTEHLLRFPCLVLGVLSVDKFWFAPRQQHQRISLGTCSRTTEKCFVVFAFPRPLLGCSSAVHAQFTAMILDQNSSSNKFYTRQCHFTQFAILSQCIMLTVLRRCIELAFKVSHSGEYKCNGCQSKLFT